MPHIARPLFIALLACAGTLLAAPSPSVAPSPSAAALPAVPLPFQAEEFSPGSDAERALLQAIAELMAGVPQPGATTPLEEQKLAAFRRFFTEFPEAKFRPVALGGYVKMIRKRGTAAELVGVARELNTRDPSPAKSEVALMLLKAYLSARGDPAKAVAVLEEQAGSASPEIAWRGELGVAQLLHVTGKRKEAIERLEKRGDKGLSAKLLLERDYTLARILHDESTQVPPAESAKIEDRVLELLRRVTGACARDPKANAAYSSAFVGLARIGLHRADARLAKEAYDTVVRLYPTSQEAQEANMLGPQLELLGKPAPAFEGPDLDGKPVSSKLMAGKIALVDFWATTCPPCLAEAPKLAKLAADARDRPFAIVSVSLDLPERGDEIRKFLAQSKIEWPQVYEGQGWKSQIAAQWKVNALPSMFLIDETGQVKRVGLEGAALREAVEAELSRFEKSRKK